MDSEISSEIRSKRRRKYIPGLAAFKFKPEPDWTFEEAQRAYNKRTSFDIPVDKIDFKDSIEAMKKMPDECVDLIVADPPFGIKFSGKERLYNRDSKLVADGYSEIAIDDYFRFTADWMMELPRIMKEQATAYIFSGWTNLNDLLTVVEAIPDLHIVNHIIWKYQFGVFTKKKFVTSHYHLLLLAKNPNNYFFNKIEHYPSDVWLINRKYRRGQMKNGTVLPLKVVERCIDFGSKPGDVVFDPFMGNGTTAMAAKANFRHFYGFEINPEMKKVIGNNVGLITSGQTINKEGSYNERWLKSNEREELVKKYPRAFKQYSEKQNE